MGALQTFGSCHVCSSTDDQEVGVDVIVCKVKTSSNFTLDDALDPTMILGHAWSEARPTITPLYKTGGLVLMRAGDRRNCDRVPFAQAYETHPRPLGSGSFGSVVLATHRRTGAVRAVKSIYKDEGRGRVRNRQEAQILSCLDHPNVIRVYEVIETDEKIIMVLELCQGGDLVQFCNKLKGPLSERNLANILLQILSAVQHIHSRGIVHRDVKPDHFLFVRRMSENPELDPTEEALQFVDGATLKLIDFGLARNRAESTPLTPRCGTSAYMSPEAHMGKPSCETLDRHDSWALGVIIYCMVSGEYPPANVGEMTIEACCSGTLWADASPMLQDLTWRFLRGDPKKRISTLEALRHPWFVDADEKRRRDLVGSLEHVSKTLPTFAYKPRLWQLAMVAAAREVDPVGSGCASVLYQVLEMVCGGAPTREALRTASKQTHDMVGEVAAVLCEMFDSLDMDGSKCLDFSELVALFVGTGAAPGLSKDVCCRTFDLFSQGGEVVSGALLDKLLAPKELARPSTSRSGNSNAVEAGVSPRPRPPRCSVGQSSPTGSLGPSAVMFDELVREVDASGSITADRFDQLLRGDVGSGDLVCENPLAKKL
eukprot:TRINITY_DN43552_c0_g1_i1.p1 TRINITY_DN43552_c0_g1~~TRINITY_DN43552_c0_g1_i1.p1  ORF type:complete len:599 (+),score=78.93 TRINITY_DN43552_c0_g1_i1:95-1891(+)